MINVTIYKDSNKSIRGFHISGHAGYADAGKDIVCAGVSTLVVTISNAIEKFTTDKFECYEDEEAGDVRLSFTDTVSNESNILMNTLVLGLTDISDSYGKKYLKISYKEV